MTPAERTALGKQTFAEVMTFPPPADGSPVTGCGLIDFVFGEMWPRPGLGLKERRLITVACVAFQDAATPIASHVWAALKSGDISFEEMDELALHFAAYCGWPKGSYLNQVISEQKQRIEAEA
jgi:4-carboxymuconolactone decarboxylase